MNLNTNKYILYPYKKKYMQLLLQNFENLWSLFLWLLISDKTYIC